MGDTIGKITCIPSNLQINDVERIIKEAKENATDNWKNPAYRRVKIEMLLFSLLFDAAFCIVVYLLFARYMVIIGEYEMLVPPDKDITYRLGATLLYIMYWTFGWIMAKEVVERKNKDHFVKYVKSGKIIIDKFKGSEKEILNSYNTVSEFMNFYNDIKEDGKYCFRFDEKGEQLVAEYSLPIDSERITFHFGPELSLIVDKEKGIIDFSILDSLYGLV